jgi:molybdopterin-binding protein
MQTLTVHQAAELLHMNVKRVQGLARSGKLPAVRVGRRWLFHRDQIERLLGTAAGVGPTPTLALSARNRLRGRIVQLRTDGLMAEVVIRIGDQDLVSIITRDSAERLSLAVGVEVFAVIKSTEVMIGRESEAGS